MPRSRARSPVGGRQGPKADLICRLLALNPAITAVNAPATIRDLASALQRYGEYWSSLPSVAAPWD